MCYSVLYIITVVLCVYFLRWWLDFGSLLPLFPSILHRPISHVVPHSTLQTQGELVDRIEYHVETTQNHVAEGHQQLKTAQEYQSKARKVSDLRFRLLDSGP